MNCPTSDQDLTVVYTLLGVLVGIVVGRLSHKIKTQDD